MTTGRPSYSHVASSVGEADASVIKSAQRVLEVFEYFADVRAPSTATEIANALGYPQSSTSMLLRSLVSLGYLDFQRETRAFEPTIRLSLLGGWIPARIEIASHIIETLTGLFEAFNETVVLAVQHRSFVRYIWIVQRPETGVSYYFRPGLLQHACTTATGVMLLTLASERDALSILHRTNAEQRDPAERLTGPQLMEQINAAKALGYAYRERQLEAWVGVQAAVLLPQKDDAPRMAVGVFSRLPRFAQRREQIVSRLLEIAKG